MVRVLANGEIVEAKMHRGLEGFATATFPGEQPVQTEMPNTLVDLVIPVKAEKVMKAMKDKTKDDKKSMKAMKAMKTMKRKKKKQKKKMTKGPGDGSLDELDDGEDHEEEEELEEEEEAKDELEEAEAEGEAEAPTIAAVPPERKTYLKMYYKKVNSFGIRQRFGDKRQIFNVSKPGWSKSKLEKLADQCLDRLHEGKGEGETKEWYLATAGKLL